MLAEISPPAFRSTFPGVAYQLGNMVSAASAQIEAGQYIFFHSAPSLYIYIYTHLLPSAVGGDQHHTTIKTSAGTETVPDYAFVQGIFIGVVAIYVIILTLFGPENHGRHFELSKTAFQAGASRDDVTSTHESSEGVNDRSSLGSGGKEKRDIQLVENGMRA